MCGHKESVEKYPQHRINFSHHSTPALSIHILQRFHRPIYRVNFPNGSYSFDFWSLHIELKQLEPHTFNLISSPSINGKVDLGWKVNT